MVVAKSATIKRAQTTEKEPGIAVASLAEQLFQREMAGVLFFCAANYFDLDALAAELNVRFSCPVMGCTTAGEVCDGYHKDSIVAISFGKSDFSIHPYLISPINDFDGRAAYKMADILREQLEFNDDFNSQEMFALGLFDGLSLMEETVIPHIATVLDGVCLVGGSAGDNQFKETLIFADGRFHKKAGLVILVETRQDFEIFKHQVFQPTDIDLVVTQADPRTRVVSEFNGAPAAEEYAGILGVDVEDLEFKIFANNPVMVEIGDQWYVRSILEAKPDHSLYFSCAIDSGLVLSLGKGDGVAKHLEELADQLDAKFSNYFCTIGFDCIDRRMVVLMNKETQDVIAPMKRLNLIGFSTFGEQINAIHVNHTLTGVVLGAKLPHAGQG